MAFFRNECELEFIISFVFMLSGVGIVQHALRCSLVARSKALKEQSPMTQSQPNGKVVLFVVRAYLHAYLLSDAVIPGSGMLEPCTMRRISHET